MQSLVDSKRVCVNARDATRAGRADKNRLPGHRLAIRNRITGLLSMVAVGDENRV